MIIDNFKVEEWFNKYEKDAVYDLADTCVQSLSVNELFDIVGQKEVNLDYLFNQKLNYGAIHGSERLKTAISSLYNFQSAENITVTHGAIGANQLVMLSLVEKGDKVVSIVPTYQQHYSIPKSIGADVSLLFLKESNNWLPDLEELEEVVGNNTKLICMNNPNNPTGAVIPENMLKEIINIAKKSDAYILCDEVYRGLCHSGNPFNPSVADLYEKGISTGSVSKVFSLAGLRLGWVVANKNIIDIVNRQREYNTISVGILDDFFAALAIENKSKIVSRNINLISQGKKILEDWLQSENSVHCVIPTGGTTAFVGYDMNISSENLCSKLQYDTGVMILPGETMELDKYLRIGYGNNFEQLNAALGIFSDWIRKNF
jgi:aspartate/methionine/tyrosine aminotransferase